MELIKNELTNSENSKIISQISIFNDEIEKDFDIIKTRATLKHWEDLILKISNELNNIEQKTTNSSILTEKYFTKAQEFALLIEQKKN